MFVRLWEDTPRMGKFLDIQDVIKDGVDEKEIGVTYMIIECCDLCEFNHRTQRPCNCGCHEE